MKKQFAALFVAGLAASAGAQAQTNVTLYGLVDAYVGSIDNSAGPNKGRATVVNSGGMTTSFIGFGGSEDLGGGLKAVFALETFMRNDTGAFGRFGSTGDLGFTRSAFVGLAGGFGQVTLGRNTAPYFLNSVFFNPFGDSFVFSPTIAHVWLNQTGNDSTTNTQGIVQGDTGLSNSIRYTSPTFAGLRADVAVAQGNQAVLGQESFANTSYGRTVDLALFYNRGPLAAGLSYRAMDLETNGVSGLATPFNFAGNAKQNSWLLGASYDLKVVKLFAQAGRSKNDFVTGDDATKKTYQLGASVPVGPGSVLASFARSTYELGTTDTTRKTWALGYSYALSKRTDAYANYYRDSLNDATDNTQAIIGVGVRHRF